VTVLVPYDGSAPAQKAVEHAVTTAGEEEIVLLRVVEVADGMIDAGFDIVQEKLRAVRDEESGELTDETRELLETEDVTFQIETAVGKPAREIVSFAEDNDVSQIVVGSHGRDRISRVLLGSVAEKVVRRAPQEQWHEPYPREQTDDRQRRRPDGDGGVDHADGDASLCRVPALDHRVTPTAPQFRRRSPPSRRWRWTNSPA
jgi:nucleotide-binding universal stress UspA family protein